MRNDSIIGVTCTFYKTRTHCRSTHLLPETAIAEAVEQVIEWHDWSEKSWRRLESQPPTFSLGRKETRSGCAVFRVVEVDIVTRARV